MNISVVESLMQNKNKIIHLWEQRAWKEVASAQNITVLALRDELPTYLDALVDALEISAKEGLTSGEKNGAEATRIGKAHGIERAGSPNYLLTEVIFEYHILREIIFQTIEEETSIPKKERDIILSFIDDAVNSAAVEFADALMEIQQKFVAAMTHDIRTPITAAKSNAELMIKHGGKADLCLRSASRIVASMNRMDSMIRDLLDYGKIRAGLPLFIQRSKCDLDSLIREIVDDTAVTYGDRLLIHSDDEVVGNWSCDSLRRAIENLIGNAVKYGAPHTSITISLKRLEHFARITIHNEGAGIPKEEQPLLFQQYRRSKSTQEGANTGWGLGLTLVKGVVDAHKGTIRVESAEGKGTSFIIEIPFE